MGRRAAPLKTAVAPARATVIVGAVTIGWAVLVLGLYFKNFPFQSLTLKEIAQQVSFARWDGALPGLFAVATAVGVLFAAWGLGHSLLRRWNVPWHSPLEETVFGWGLGQGVLSYILLAVGALQGYRPAVLWGLYLSTLAWAFYQWRAGGLRQLARDAWSQTRARTDGERGDGFLRALLVAVFILNGLMCFVPEVFYDALVYHLGVPRWYLLEGGLRYYPAYHAQFPFARQMINLFGLALQGDTLAKLLHFSTSVQILGTFLALADRFARRRVGLLASLIFLSVPMVAMNLWTTGVDVALTAVSLLALAAGLIALTAPAPRPWVVVSGVFLGLTVSTKYPGGVDAAVWGGVFFFHRVFIDKNPRAALRDLAILVGVAALVFLPWLVKNAVLTGNPVYPYLHGLFGGRDLLPEKLAIFSADIAQGAARDPVAFLTAPWRLTFTLMGSASAPGLFPLGLLGAMLWGFFRGKERPLHARPLAAYVVLYGAAMLVLTSQTRYAIPGLAAHAFLIGEAIDALGRAAGPFVRRGLTATVFVTALAGVDMAYFTATRAYAPWSLLTGGESRRDYQSYSHLTLNPGPAAEGYDYLKEKWAGDARVLILGDEKVFPCAVPFRASGVFNEQLITRWAREAGTPEKLWDILVEREGITHLLFNVPSNLRLMSYNQYLWDPRALGVVCEFWDRHVRLVHRAAVPEKVDARFLNETRVYVLAPAGALPGVPPPENPLLFVEEERVGPRGASGWREKRLALLDAILTARPVPSVEKRRQALLSSPT